MKLIMDYYYTEDFWTAQAVLVAQRTVGPFQATPSTAYSVACSQQNSPRLMSWFTVCNQSLRGQPCLLCDVKFTATPAFLPGSFQNTSPFQRNLISLLQFLPLPNYRSRHSQSSVRDTAKFGTANMAQPNFRTWLCRSWLCQTTVRGTAKFQCLALPSLALPNHRTALPTFRN